MKPLAQSYSKKPLGIDLFAGLGGWTEGLIAEGYRVVGFDNVRHEYGTAKYPGQLVIQDVLTLHGSQFRNAALIVASPPCQAYSYRAMPWKRAKALPPPDNTLFEACFRIQREASEAARHLIPLVVENVCGAQKWLGRARWHFGSFYLWGDVPALMPITRLNRMKAAITHRADDAVFLDFRSTKVPGLNWSGSDKPSYKAQAFNTTAEQRLREGQKTSGHINKRDGHSHTRHLTNAREHEGIKVKGNKLSENGFAIPVARQIDKSLKPSAFSLTNDDRRQHLSYPRKAASAHIAKIPLALARHIAASWKPIEMSL